MTGVPIVVDGRGEPTAESLAGTLVADGRPLPVVAVERGPMDIAVVLEHGAVLGLGGHGRQLDRDPAYARTGLVLGEGDEVRFVSATPSRVVSQSLPFDLFPMSTPFTRYDGELPYLLTHVSLGEPGEEQRLADAVATAAVEVAGGNRRRMVVLVLGDRWEDSSAYSIDEVKGFLESLGVPFVVWTTGPAQTRTISDSRLPVAMKTEWGMARNLSSITRLLESATQLMKDLESQRIVWVEGSHLPGSVTLARSAKGIELAR